MQKLIMVLSLLLVSFFSHVTTVDLVHRPITPDSPIAGRSQLVQPSVQGRVTPVSQSRQPVSISEVQGVVTPHGQNQEPASRPLRAAVARVRPRTLVF